MGGTVNGTPVGTSLPTLTVTLGSASTSLSTVSLSAGTVASGSTLNVTLQAKDGGGNNLSSGGLTVAFAATGGTSTAAFSATTDHNNGTYSAVLTGIIAGSAARAGPTI